MQGALAAIPCLVAAMLVPATATGNCSACPEPPYYRCDGSAGWYGEISRESWQLIWFYDSFIQLQNGNSNYSESSAILAETCACLWNSGAPLCTAPTIYMNASRDMPDNWTMTFPSGTITKAAFQADFGHGLTKCINEQMCYWAFPTTPTTPSPTTPSPTTSPDGSGASDTTKSPIAGSTTDGSGASDTTKSPIEGSTTDGSGASDTTKSPIAGGTTASGGGAGGTTTLALNRYEATVKIFLACGDANTAVSDAGFKNATIMAYQQNCDCTVAKDAWATYGCTRRLPAKQRDYGRLLSVSGVQSDFVVESGSNSAPSVNDTSLANSLKANLNNVGLSNYATAVTGVTATSGPAPNPVPTPTPTPAPDVSSAGRSTATAASAFFASMVVFSK